MFVGALVWVRRRNGSWWPGKALGDDELPEGCSPTPRVGTPVQLLGEDGATVEWYNLDTSSKRVKAFRCGEFSDCIEKAKAYLHHRSNPSNKYVRRDDAILEALEIESAECLEQDHHVDSEESEDLDEDLTRSEDDITPRIELATSQWLIKGKRNARKRKMFVSPPAALYDVPVEVQASYRPHHVPYISLMSKVNNRPIVGHPIEIQVLKDGSCDCIIDSISESHSSSSSSSSESEYKVPLSRHVNMVYSRGRPPTKNLSLQRYASIAKSKKITRKLSSSTTGSQGKNREEEHKLVVEKLKGPVVACVPLKVVFSRINAALR